MKCQPPVAAVVLLSLSALASAMPPSEDFAAPYRILQQANQSLDASLATSAYASDGVLIFVRPDGQIETYRGSQAIRDAYSRTFELVGSGASIDVDFRFDPPGLRSSRQTGAYKVLVTAGPKALETYGRFSAKLIMENGSWRFAEDRGAVASALDFYHLPPSSLQPNSTSRSFQANEAAAREVAASSAVTPIDAERAFARDAQNIGQWTAFERWAAPGALILLPQPADARTFLRGRENPAKALEWWPNLSLQSCDGTTAIHYGGAVGPGDYSTNFITVWFRYKDAWRWTFDIGEAVSKALPRNAEIEVRRASCKNIPRRVRGTWAKTSSLRNATSATENAMSAISADSSLAWAYRYDPKSKFVQFRGWLWNGRDYELVFDKAIPPV